MPKQTRATRRAAKKAAKKGVGAPKKEAGAGKEAAPLPGAAAAGAGTEATDDPDQKRRARSVARQHQAAQVKRDRSGKTRPQTATVRENRSALLVMILTLGLLIATVAVTGGLIASSMRTRPVTLAAPLHIYPVAATVPGQCQAGTQGISWPTATGPTCYVLTQGIAIRRVADLRLQRSKAKGAYDVALTLRTTDRKAFADLTRAMVGKDLAFVVRDRLVTVPRVEMPISDGKVVITGTNSKGDADKLLRELKGK
ncbi:SecDF P1 head subdomain-containing protein [Actinomadura sp. 6N118]|uniref:SecDF P1 head subdomain-containing protein n=1 Tax=Actinomadura sp. 6N118 TaxID=3375151 RepID=UPI003794F97A